MSRRRAVALFPRSARERLLRGAAARRAAADRTAVDEILERPGRPAVLRRVDPQRRRDLRSGLRLFQPELAGGARDPGRPGQLRSSRAAPDRGQPTYFLPRRQGWVYRLRVPSDFGKQVVTWTVTANGKTQKAYGELLPVEEITERIIMTRGNLNPGDDDPNKPPAIDIAPVRAGAERAGHADRHGHRRWIAEAAAGRGARTAPAPGCDGDPGASQFFGHRTSARVDRLVDGDPRAGARSHSNRRAQAPWSTARRVSRRGSAREEPTSFARPQMTARLSTKADLTIAVP